MDDPDVDAAEMAKQLAELEKKDPEFYKYLRENDADLLTFGQEEEVAPKSKKSKKTKGKAVEEEEEDDEDMDEYDGADSDSDEDEPEFEGISGAEPEKISVTMKMLRGWQRAMIEQHSLRSLRKMVLAFRAAAHMDEAGEEHFETRYKVDSALGELRLCQKTHLVLLMRSPFQFLTS
jgi:nucleolar complex protein 2